MKSRFQIFSGILIGAVWVFHGLYSKLLDGIPRHGMIVERILGEDFARPAIIFIGIAEILLGLWAWTGRHRPANAIGLPIVLFSRERAMVRFPDYR